MAAIQQQQLQQQLLQQQLVLQQQAAAQAAVQAQQAARQAAKTAALKENGPANKKQRELYVGNLNPGVVTDNILTELFNGALAHLVADAQCAPPVINARIDPNAGRFGFVELRTEELATAALALDKVELCGRHLVVGRCKGYVEPPGGPTTPQMGLAQLYAAQLANQPTKVLLLENMLPARTLLDEKERNELQEDVQEESLRYGTVQGVCVPVPPAFIGSLEGGRCYINFATPVEAARAREVFHGRTFDGNSIKASYVSEEDYQRAENNEWLPSKDADGNEIDPALDPNFAAAAAAAAVQGPLAALYPGLLPMLGLAGIPGAAGLGAAGIPGAAALGAAGLQLPGPPPMSNGGAGDHAPPLPDQ